MYTKGQGRQNSQLCPNAGTDADADADFQADPNPKAEPDQAEAEGFEEAEKGNNTFRMQQYWIRGRDKTGHNYIYW